MGEWSILFIEKGTNPALFWMREIKIWLLLFIRGLEKAPWILLLIYFTVGSIPQKYSTF